MNTASDRTSLRIPGWFHRRPSGFSLVCMLVAGVLAFFSVYPLTRVVGRLFVADGSLTIAPIRKALDAPGLGELLFNTVVVVGISGVLALVIGSFLAWVSERTDARMGVVSEGVPLIPFMLPPVAGAVGWVLLFSPRAGLGNAFIRWILSWFGIHREEGPFDIFTFYGMILAYTVFMVPIVFLMVSTGLRNMDPALEEQSQVCGSGKVRTFFRVTLAALRPNIGGAILLLVWFGMAMFSVPSIIGTGAEIEVLSVRIVRLLSFSFPPDVEQAVGLCLFIVLAVGAAWYLQGRTLKRGHHATVGGKGFRGAPVPLGKWKLPVRIFALSYMLLGSVLPIAALALVTLNGFWTADLSWSEFDLDTFHTIVVKDDGTRTAIINSVKLGVIGGVIGITAATLLALYVKRTGGWIARTVEATIRLPAAISGLVLAVGVLLAFAGPPFNLHGSMLILLIAYVVLYMPQASVAADAAVSQVGKELPEASQVCGGGGWRTFRKVQFPIMAGGLAAGWAMQFVIMTGELQAAAMLTSADNVTVGFKILETFNNGSYALLAALALVLTMITSTVVIVVLVLARRRNRWGTQSSRSSRAIRGMPTAVRTTLHGE